MAEQTIAVPTGYIVVTTHGSWQADTAMAWGNLREHFVRSGLNAQFVCVNGSLVDRARNQSVDSFLRATPKAEWLAFIDADMIFGHDALHQLLAFAYGEGREFVDAIGGYCTLRGEPYLPTIDTGTGTWESVMPGNGPLEVMRTGAAFILFKRHVFERIPGPWFGTRNPMRPIDALAEVDNFARTRFDGKNPLYDTTEWKTLLQCAKDDPSTHQPMNPYAFVGEDSNWCDLLRFHGFRIFVQTDTEIHHIDRRVLSAADHKEAMEKAERATRVLVGCMK